MPQVSVIIPTYKHRNFVLLALESVFAQTFTDYEVIVINDGSPDDTAEVLRPLVEQGRIRYIEQRNQGQATARNRGISEAKGEFIALLDDDDEWPSDKLLWQVEALKANPEAILVYGFVKLAMGGNEYCYPDADAPSGWVFDQFVSEGWIRSPGQTLIRKSVLRDVGGFDSSIWGTDDWELYIRLAKQGPFIYGHHLSLNYRYHESNASHDYWKMYRNALKVLWKHFGKVPTPSNFRQRKACLRFLQKFCSGDAESNARQLMSQNQWTRAGVTWLRCIYIKPTLLRRRYIWKNLILCFSPSWTAGKWRRLHSLVV
jgi:glycosyltransferase involved in cell wall biosynthesis